MSWRDTWRETVESFRRELRGPGEAVAPGDDPVARAIAEARAAVGGVERELALTEERLVLEEEAAEACRRRRGLAERISDRNTAAVAGRFERRHHARADVLRRKRQVLRDEQALARLELSELLELARGEAHEEVGLADAEQPGA